MSPSKGERVVYTQVKEQWIHFRLYVFDIDLRKTNVTLSGVNSVIIAEFSKFRNTQLKKGKRNVIFKKRIKISGMTVFWPKTF